MIEVNKPKFIVFEGVGGCGKSSQVSRAHKILENNSIPAVVTREPGGCEPSEEIRNLIFDLKRQRLIYSEGQVALFSAARRLWVEGVVKPNLEQGNSVLSDRSYVSTLAFKAI